MYIKDNYDATKSHMMVKQIPRFLHQSYAIIDMIFSSLVFAIVCII